VTKRKKKSTRRRTQRTRRTKRTQRTRSGPPALRWNPDPEDVQRSVVQLVLSLIEFIRKLMERQAVRRLEEKTLTPEEIENVGLALMKLEQTIHQIAKRFKLDPEDLNLDLGPVGRLH
jgi:Gas vesicle protein K